MKASDIQPQPHLTGWKSGHNEKGDFAFFSVDRGTGNPIIRVVVVILFDGSHTRKPSMTQQIHITIEMTG
jgi:hypothetical protein